MKVIYKNWEKDQGLEEIQAKIYTGVSGLPTRATAEEIAARNNRRGPEMTHYALTENGEPLAYITSNIDDDEPWEALIGYPWAMPECPPEVQEKIFNDQLNHLKRKESLQKLVTAVILASKIADKQQQFFINKGFTIDEIVYLYDKNYDIEEVSKWNLDEKAKQLTSRSATNDDLELFYEVNKSDAELSRDLSEKEAMKNYYEGRVLKDGHAILLFDGDKVVAASAPLRFKGQGVFIPKDEEVIIMRFTALRPEYAYAWKRLAVEIAKECIKSGWTDLPFRIRSFHSTRSTVARGIAEITPEITAFELILKTNI
jgi:SOS response regulatory protein OraA/RecX